MTRRTTSRRGLAVAALVPALVAGGCSLGDRQERADRIIDASERTLAAGSLKGTLSAKVVLVKPKKPAPPGPPRITPAASPPVPVQADLKAGTAAVGADPAMPVLLFTGPVVYQRRVVLPSASTAAIPIPGTSPSLPGTDPAAPGATAAPTTAPAGSTDAPPGGLALPAPAATSGLPPTNLLAIALPKVTSPTSGKAASRPWVKLDYDRLDRDADDKTAGSVAISPIVLVRLLRGTLAGSVEQLPDSDATSTHYKFRFSRDKAERGLPNKERIQIEKAFSANAMAKDIAKGEAWVAPDGTLQRFTLTFRQTLDSIHRADLTVAVEVTSLGEPVQIELPAKRQVSVVPTLGALVRAALPSS